MQFEKYVLIRDIEDPKKWETQKIKIGLKEYMAEDCDKIGEFCLSLFFVWFLLCLMFSSVLGFVYILKTYF